MLQSPPVVTARGSASVRKQMSFEKDIFKEEKLRQRGWVHPQKIFSKYLLEALCAHVVSNFQSLSHLFT